MLQLRAIPQTSLSQAPSRLLLCLVALLATGTARAQDRFEIQVYGSETARVDKAEVEIHVNHVFSGTTSPSSQGELPTQGVTHLTVEPHLGLTDWAEIGAYLQSALLPSGSFLIAGVKLRAKVRSPWKVANLVGLALNLEFSDVPRVFEANRLGIELRPIADIHWKRLYASINPIIGVDLAGPLAGHPQLEPAAKVAVDVFKWLMLGAEYYSGLGPVLSGPGDSAHILFGAIDVTSPWVDVNLGVGYGFAGDERWVGKVIFGFHEPPPANPPK